MHTALRTVTGKQLPVLSLVLTLLMMGWCDVGWGQMPINGGFEDGLNNWTLASGNTVATSAYARTGTYSMLTGATTSTTNQANTNSSTITVPNGSYGIVIGWAKGTNSSANASVGGTLNSSSSSTITNNVGTVLTQLIYNSSQNVSGSPVPFSCRVNNRSSTGPSTQVYFDDVIMYASTSSTPDITKPSTASSFATGSISSNSISFSWSNGTDAGTGIQNTIILRTTNLSATTPILNDQGVYSTTGGIAGPNTVATDWTVISISIGAAVSTYSDNTVTNGTSYKYAIVHRDMAYNYSTALVSGTLTATSSSAPVLSISGLSSHGTTCPNTSTTPITYTITNNGGVQANGIAVSSNDPQFAVSNLSSTSIAANGGTATYNVTFTPTSAGSKSAIITVTSTTSGSNAPTSALTGTGTTPVAQAVTTSAANSVAGTSATLNGNVTTLGVCPATIEKGFVYAVSSTNNDPQAGGAGVTKTSVSGIATGAYLLALSGLPNGTVYTFKAYVFNGTAYTYGSALTFTTNTPPANDDCSGAENLIINGSALTGTFAGSTPMNGATKNDVFYKFTPTVSGTYNIIINNFSIAGDKDIYVYSTCPSTYSTSTDVVASGATTSTSSETASGTFTFGTSYKILVQDFGGSGGTFHIAITGPLDAPVANAATNIGANSFTANWSAVTGAIGYKLDVSTSNTFSAPNASTLNEGFETGMPTVGYSTGTYALSSGGWTFVNILRAATNDSYSGTYGCQFQGNTNASAMSPSLDKISSISFYAKRGTNSTSISVQKIVGGITTTVQIVNLTTTYTQYTIPINETNSGVQIKFLNGSAVAYMDDVSIQYTDQAPTFVSGYNNLAVSGTSQSVTGLSPNTSYYYRVRATNTNSTSANSSTITVLTLNDPATAAYRTKQSGNFSAVATWQYNATGNTYVDASGIPSTTNNITIQNNHTLTLDANFNVTKNFTINTGGAMLIAPSKTFSVAVGGTANFSGQPVTVQSNSVGTGRIGQIAGTLSNATNLIVERYIPAKDKRRWTFIASPVQQSIRDSWQQQVFITGPGTGGTICATNGSQYNSNGFDVTVGNPFSMFTYEATVSSLTNSRYTGISNTTATSLIPGKGYRVNIRGDRTDANACATQINYTGAAPAPGAVTLRATGNYYTAAPIALNDPAIHAYTLLGNPYPSEISFKAFKSGNSKINDKAWIYSSGNNANNTDKYSTWNDGQITNPGYLPDANKEGSYPNYTDVTISSGGAFFVEANAAGTVSFAESNKTTTIANGNGVYSRAASPWTNYIRIHLQTEVDSLQEMDNIIVRFKNSTQVSNTQYGVLDAYSFNSATSSLASLKAGGRMAIQTKRLDFVGKDTVNLAANAAAGNYRFSFTEYEQFTKATYIYLIDNYLHTITNVKQQAGGYPFSITADTSSQGSNRFAVIFSTKPIKTTPAVQYTKVSTGEPEGQTKAAVQFGVYPNPVQNELHINVGAKDYKRYRVELLSVTGVVLVVKEGVVKGGTISLSTMQLRQGTYIAHLYLADGAHYTKKFVRQ